MSNEQDDIEQDGQTENEIELRLLAKLQERPNVSQRGLAADLGVSLGSINFCLKALTAKGFVKAENFSKAITSWAMPIATPRYCGQSRPTASFLKRKRAEYRRLAHEIADLEALRQEKLIVNDGNQPMLKPMVCGTGQANGLRAPKLISAGRVLKPSCLAARLCVMRKCAMCTPGFPRLFIHQIWIGTR